MVSSKGTVSVGNFAKLDLFGRPRVIAVFLSLILAFAVWGKAWAHAGLIRSEPADNAILADSPEDVRLWFKEPVSAEFSSAFLLDVNGKEVKLDRLSIDPSDPSLMIIDPPELSAGVYSLHWKVLSETDGHVTQGLLVFGIGEGTDLGTASSALIKSSVPPLEVLLRWLNFSLQAALLGALAILLLVIGIRQQPNQGEVAARTRERIFRWASVCAWMTLVLGFAWLAYQQALLMAATPEGASPFSVAWQLIDRTRWGVLWQVRQVCALGIALALRWPQRRIALPAATLLGGLMASIQALSGHAAGLSPLTFVAVAADALHILSASMWVGGLLALVVGTFPYLRHCRSELLPQIQSSWGAFSRWAALSVGILAVTGIYAVGRQTASLDAVITTLYGRALSGKVALMLATGAVGLLNFTILHPQISARVRHWLHQGDDWKLFPLERLRRLVLVEASLGLLIFLLTGVLTAAPPAQGPEFAPAPKQRIDSMTRTIDDMLVNFSTKPNLPGQNIFTIRAVSQRRPPPAEVLRLILRFTYLEEDIGTVSADAKLIEPDNYQLGGSYFNLPGKWQVDVVVRRRGLEDSVARYDWFVPAAAGRPAVISNQPWEPWLTGAAAVLLILVVALLVSLRSGQPGKSLPQD